ncbi:hypothetical protein V6N11_023837 [Hibiscus sabdariffa]|uniref:Uncharacterized protein n=1 Tax=Hibiscus sabdariffa TaxID=183260 RepID=A0ABR2TND6_9ROSI
MSMEANGSASVIADDSDLEFLMDSHSSRILQRGLPVTDRAGNRGKPVVHCGRNTPYKRCTPKRNPGPRAPPKCGIYNRECGRRTTS